MKKSIIIALGVVFAALVSVVAQPARLHTKPALPTPDFLQRHGLKKRWHAYVPMAGIRDGVTRAQALDGQVIVQTLSGAIVALDAETGATHWHIRLGEPYQTQQEYIAENRTTLVAVVGLKLYGIDRKSGAIEWTIDLPGVLATGPGIDSSRCYLATASGMVHAYVLPASSRTPPTKPGDEAAGGASAPVRVDPYDATNLRVPKHLYAFNTNSTIAMPPVVLDNFVVLANGTGVLYSLDRNTPKLSASFRTNSPFSAPISRFGSDIFVGSEDHTLYAFDVVPGRLNLLWRYSAESRIMERPAVMGDELYVVGLGEGLFCLDRHTGQRKWRQRDAHSFLTASGRLVFAANDRGGIVILDRSKGTVLSTWNADSYAVKLQNHVTDRLYLANHDGLVICLQDTDKKYDKPMLHNPPPKPAEEKPMDAAAAEKPMAPNQ